MPLEIYPQAGFELLGDCVHISRFMKMRTFRRFIESGSLHFCRADLFDDEHEGLPLEQFCNEPLYFPRPRAFFVTLFPVIGCHVGSAGGLQCALQGASPAPVVRGQFLW